MPGLGAAGGLEGRDAVRRFAAERGIESLFALGDASIHATTAFTRAGGAEARHFGDIEALDAAVLAHLPRIASVLVKGSRFMRMERVVQAIAAASAQRHNNKEEGRP